MDETEVLLNVREKAKMGTDVSCKTADSDFKKRLVDEVSARPNSFRANLNRGKRKIMVLVTDNDKDWELCFKCLENGRNKLRFR